MVRTINPGNYSYLHRVLMKKITLFLVGLLYLASTCEAMVYLHYCMGKAVSISFHADKSSHCPKCGMKKSAKGSGCCKDEQKQLKQDPAQKGTDGFASLIFAKQIIHSEYLLQDISVSIPSVLIESSSLHGPPDISSPPVFLMNRNLLI